MNFVGILSSPDDLLALSLFNSAATSQAVGGNKTIEEGTPFLRYNEVWE